MATATEERVALEPFDGSDPSAYRRWRRRAQLMLAALPTTVGKGQAGGKAYAVCEGRG